MSTTITKGPVSDEAVSGTWSGSVGSRFSLVDDYPDASGADFLTHGTTAGNITFNWAVQPSVPADAANISVVVDYYDRKNASQSCNVGGRLKVGGSYFNASTHNPANGVWTQRSDTFATNPKTAAAWTADDINGVGANALQAFGWFSSDASPAIDLSSIQIRVVYVRQIQVTLDPISFTETLQDTTKDLNPTLQPLSFAESLQTVSKALTFNVDPIVFAEAIQQMTPGASQDRPLDRLQFSCDLQDISYTLSPAGGGGGGGGGPAPGSLEQTREKIAGRRLGVPDAGMTRVSYARASHLNAQIAAAAAAGRPFCFEPGMTYLLDDTLVIPSSMKIYGMHARLRRSLDIAIDKPLVRIGVDPQSMGTNNLGAGSLEAVIGVGTGIADVAEGLSSFPVGAYNSLGYGVLYDTAFQKDTSGAQRETLKELVKVVSIAGGVASIDLETGNDYLGTAKIVSVASQALGRVEIWDLDMDGRHYSGAAGDTAFLMTACLVDELVLRNVKLGRFTNNGLRVVLCRYLDVDRDCVFGPSPNGLGGGEGYGIDSQAVRVGIIQRSHFDTLRHGLVEEAGGSDITIQDCDGRALTVNFFDVHGGKGRRIKGNRLTSLDNTEILAAFGNGTHVAGCKDCECRDSGAANNGTAGFSGNALGCKFVGAHGNNVLFEGVSDVDASPNPTFPQDCGIDGGIFTPAAARCIRLEGTWKQTTGAYADHATLRQMGAGGVPCHGLPTLDGPTDFSFTDTRFEFADQSRTDPPISHDTGAQPLVEVYDHCVFNVPAGVTKLYHLAAGAAVTASFIGCTRISGSALVAGDIDDQSGGAASISIS